MPPNPQPPQYPMVAQRRGSLESLHRPETEVTQLLPKTPAKMNESRPRKDSKMFPSNFVLTKARRFSFQFFHFHLFIFQQLKGHGLDEWLPAQPGKLRDFLKVGLFLIRNNDVILGEIRDFLCIISCNSFCLQTGGKVCVLLKSLHLDDLDHLSL